MTDQKEKHRKWLYIITAIVIIAGGGLIVRLIMAQTCKQQQNIFFTEYDLDVDTTIYEYDHIKNEVSELGKVKGCFYNCMVDSEEIYFWLDII